MLKQANRRYIFFPVILIFLVSSWRDGAYSAFASTFPLAENLRQVDIDGDGQPDLTQWETQLDGQPFAIAVYDGGRDMKWSDDWSEATDFANDLWLFDSGADSSIEIIIRFKTLDQDRYQALIWDDRDGDRQVSVRFEGILVEVLESRTPRLIVETVSDWVSRAGNPGGNLTFRYDGILESEKTKYPGILQEKWLIDYDGNYDFQTQVVVQDDDGAIDYVHTHLLTRVPIEFQITREGMRVNVGQQEPILSGETLYWPLFNYDPGYDSGNYFDSPPLVAIDWFSARIINYGIIGYPVEEGYHINDQNPWKEGETNHADFENMMAYYDLANNNDGLPELHIRNVYWPHRNSAYSENSSMDVNEVVYSWRHQPSSHLDWDYKLSLAGSKPITSVVDFEGFSLYLNPYLELPGWVIHHDWVNTTFVATEDRDYVSSEGIYEWSTTEGVINDFTHYDVLVPDSETAQKECVAGLGPCDLSQFFTDIAVGLRGEFKSEPGQPRLYFSPIDQRLHLRGAKLGLWRLSPRDVLKYSDQSGDGIFDTWKTERMIERDYVVREELRFFPPFLIHMRDNQIRIRKSDLAPVQFETTPPTNHEEWKDLSTALAPFWETKPKQLAQMFEQVSGPTQVLEGAIISDFRMTETGYRFVLTLQSGFQNQETELIPALDALLAGDHVVTYLQETDSFEIEPLTPPKLSTFINAAPLTHLQPARIDVSVENHGLRDVPEATLELWANRSRTVGSIVASQPLTILSQERRTASFSWTPPSDGPWILTPVIRQRDGEMIAGNSLQVPVLEAQTADFVKLVPLSVPGKFLPFIVIGLVSFAAIGSLAFFQAWIRTLSQGKNRGT